MKYEKGTFLWAVRMMMQNVKMRRHELWGEYEISPRGFVINQEDKEVVLMLNDFLATDWEVVE